MQERNGALCKRGSRCENAAVRLGVSHCSMPQAIKAPHRSRPCFLCAALLLACCASLAFTPEASAQDAYPSRPVRYVVSDSPGSNIDILARVVADGLSKVFGRQLVVDNRPGAGGNIGAEIAARAAANGYTLAQIATTHAVNATLYRKLGYDLLRDFAPVTNLASGPSIAVVPVGSAIRSIADGCPSNSAENQPGGSGSASPCATKRRWSASMPFGSRVALRAAQSASAS